MTHWVHPEVHDYLAAFCDPMMPTGDEAVWSQERVAQLAVDADAIVTCMADTVDEPFLDRCRRLRVVSATLKGYDNFDADACAKRGVWLTVVPDTIIAPTAELTVGLLLGLMRQLREGDAHVRSGDFAGWRPRLYGASLQGSVVGIVGMGQLGQGVARRLSGFDTRPQYYDAKPLGSDRDRELGVTYKDLSDLLEHCQAVVVTLPLTEQTRRLIDSSKLAQMRPGAFLVNVGRGSVVDEDAVADALETGRLGGYAADVFAMEDWALPGRPPAIPKRLLRHPRTLFTPHLGSAVDDVRRAMSLEAARQVLQVVEGRRPDHPVNEPLA